MVDRDVNSVANIINFALFVVNNKLTRILIQIYFLYLLKVINQYFYSSIDKPELLCRKNKELRSK
jgi:hypothetical protein